MAKELLATNIKNIDRHQHGGFFVFRIVRLVIISSVLCSKGYAVLDFETAWQRVLQCAPSIGVADTEIGSLEGEAQQVSLIPNPIFEVEAENIGVAHPTEDTEPPQSTYSLTQLIELGGKRSARQALACSMTETAVWEAQIERQNLFLELKLAFIHASAAQEKMRISKDRLRVAEHSLTVTKRQIENGKVSPLQERKAHINLMSERLATREAQTVFIQAKERIAAMWGGCGSDFDGVQFELFNQKMPPNKECVIDYFFETPDFYRAKQLMNSASKNVQLQKANRIPDVVFTFGYRIFHDSNEGGFVVGAEVPLPLFNRNQGAIKSALCELNQSEYQLDDMIREGQEQIALSYERACASFEESELIRTGVLHEALETWRLTEEGYQMGKVDYLDLLDTHKMVCEIQEMYIDILSEYHKSLAELSRLSGVNL